MTPVAMTNRRFPEYFLISAGLSVSTSFLSNCAGRLLAIFRSCEILGCVTLKRVAASDCEAPGFDAK